MDEKFLPNFDAMRRAVEQATSSSNVAMLATAVDTAQRFASTIDFERVSSTLATIEHAFGQYERLSMNSALVDETIASMLAHASAPPVGIDFKMPEIPLLSTRIHEFTDLNNAVTRAMSSIQFDSLPALDRSLGRRLASLSNSYRDIFAGLPKVEFPLPDFMVELPARDLIVKTTIVSSRTINFKPADATIDLRDPAYARSDVDLMLADLDPVLITMLDEAVEVVFGTSGGRVRHASVSLRELSMHVLHQLAPDGEVFAWTQDQNHYHEGRPTRQARVLYVCRHLNYGPYGRYLKKSVSATVAFFDTLNCLHEVRPDVSDFQLRLMLTDVIGILRFLLRTAKHCP